MGQLQKRFEDQNQAQFQESTETVVVWTPKSGKNPHGDPETLAREKVLSRVAPGWHVRALQAGLIAILALLLVLIFG